MLNNRKSERVKGDKHDKWINAYACEQLPRNISVLVTSADGELHSVLNSFREFFKNHGRLLLLMVASILIIFLLAGMLIPVLLPLGENRTNFTRALLFAVHFGTIEPPDQAASLYMDSSSSFLGL